ncbi:hypothetical protein CTI12_AA473000 [Artemisia annua]|uniref:Pentatricopeptide repeat-containing protein n=1 Tax=Artemisia annua TaxID=35608 RepID=A0A2U1LHX6_ARTAN|nr:hypothetical protein CTI12_AA473000 [Artemisia annua]
MHKCITWAFDFLSTNKTAKHKNHRIRVHNSVALGTGNDGKLNDKNGFLNIKIKRVSAVIKSPNGKAVNGEKSLQYNGNGTNEISTRRNFEEFENKNHLRRLIRNGELEEGFKYLENMVYRGDIHMKKATRVMEILEESGVVPDVITCNVLISGYCRAEKLEEAMVVLARQMEKECYPDVITYTILIEAACKMSGVGQAMKLLDTMKTKGCKPDVFTYNVLINGFCKEGRLDDAVKFLNNMPSTGCQPNVVTHNTILRSMCSMGKWIDAEKFVADMLKKGCAPSVVTFNILITFLCQRGLSGRAIDILEKMPTHGCTPDSLSYNPLLHGFCKEKKMDRAIEYLEVMVSRGCYPDIVTYNTLLTALCKDGKVDFALEILNHLSFEGCSPVLITYNTVIDGLSKIGKTGQAIMLIDEMKQKGLQPDIITYSSVSIKLKGVDLLSLCRRKLGNGETVSFWDDCWCGDQSLKSKFPRIYLLDNDKGYNVANRLSLPDWGSVLRRNPRGGIEAFQFTDLRLLIEPVVLNPHRDTWTWSLGVHKELGSLKIKNISKIRW